MDLSYSDNKSNKDWGADFAEVISEDDLQNINICHVRISDLNKIAHELSKVVLDNSWIMELDPGSHDTYEITVAETAKILVKKIQNLMTSEDKISSEFGEIMVSMGASKALEVIFDHISLPLAELWKPQASGNEGFDFHTICPDTFFNFGEAKFSGSSSVNPYGGGSGSTKGAGGQADGFIKQKKHKRDRPYLKDLELEQKAIDHLDQDKFGVILAFSLNSSDALSIYAKAVSKALQYQNIKQAQKIYIVGVSHVSP